MSLFTDAQGLDVSAGSGGTEQQQQASSHPNEAQRAHQLAQSDASFRAQTETLNFFNFFGGLLVPEEDQRAEALQSIAEQLLDAARDVAASAPAVSGEPLSHSAELLQAHLPSVLRLALACPLKDITAGMKQLLRDLAAIDEKAYGKYVIALEFAFQPSLFVPLSSCVDPTGLTSEGPVSNLPGEEDACESTRELVEDIFLSTGRLSHLDLLMAWHPSYLTEFTSCMHYVMDDAGPLPHTWRNYLAIMAAARHHCEYLVSLQETEYLLKGGDPVWLKGIAYAPKKLQALCELNALLAHQPWLINKSHIAALVHNAGVDSWSIAELVHALVILSTFHSLCGFVYALGLRKEIDGMDWASWEPVAREGAPGKYAGPQPLQRRPTPSLGGDFSAQTPLNSPAVAGGHHPSHSSMSITASPGFLAAPQPSAPSDGEHLLRLLSGDNLAPSDGLNAHNAFNSAVEELGTSPAQHSSSSTHNTPALPPRSQPPQSSSSSSSTQGLNDLNLGEGMSGGGASASSSNSGNISALASGLRGVQLSDDPHMKYLAVAYANPLDGQLTSPAASVQQAAHRIALMKYANFDVNSKSYSIFFLHDYSWKEHGYALVNRFLGTSDVSVASHSTVTLTVHGSDTTLDLMRALARKTGIEVDQQRLVYEGRDLLPHQALADSNVHAESTLTLLLRLHGGGEAEEKARMQDQASAAANDRAKNLYRYLHQQLSAPDSSGAAAASSSSSFLPPPPPSPPVVTRGGEPAFQVFVVVPTLERRNQGFAQMLDAQWDGIFSLTYRTVSDQTNVDTTPFRRAIWYYTHRLFGLQHDDYNYNRIPVFLTHSLKTYVRKIVCSPESITQADYELRGYSFKASEKCHIVLLAMEARRQASMLYALHAVMKYIMTNEQ